MSSLAIRRAARRRRHHGAALFAALPMSCAVAVHHSGPPIDAMHHDGHTGPVVELCVAVFVAIGTAVAAVAIGLIALGRWRPLLDVRPGGLSTARGVTAGRRRRSSRKHRPFRRTARARRIPTEGAVDAHSAWLVTSPVSRSADD